MLFKLRYAFFFCSAFLIFNSAFAGPWLLPGDLSVKSDIDLLADAGLITAPVTTWPLAWVNIGPPLLSPQTQEKLRLEPPAVQEAAQRIIALYKESYQPEKLQTSTYVSGGNNLNPFKTFQYQPYNNFASGASAGYQTDSVATDLDLNYYSAQGQTYSNYVHLDNSYAYWMPGNWAVGVDQFNRWWGPGYSDSMVLSSNAEPMPTFTVQRMEAEPFQTKWLSWLGPWSFTTFFTDMGPGFYPYPQTDSIDNAIGWFTDISFRPLESLQLEVSRVVLFSGNQRPLNWPMIGNLFLEQHSSSCGDELCSDDPGTQNLNIAGEWSFLPIFNIPADVYIQTLFNDVGKPIGLAKTAFLLGGSTTAQFTAGTLKTYLEYENNVQNTLWFWSAGQGGPYPNIYGDSAPYYYGYYNQLLGSALGSEGIGTTLGEIFNENSGNSDTAMIRYLRLNVYNWGSEGTPGYPFSKQNVLWVSVGRTMALPHNIGSLSSQLGYLKSVSGSGLSSGVSTTFTWSKNF